MSKRRRVSVIGLPLAAMLNWFKSNVRRCGQDLLGMLASIKDGRRRDQFDVARPADEERIELEEFIKILNIGDRIRVLCDDGLLVAEKVSETQFELIHSQMMSKRVQ